MISGKMLKARGWPEGRAIGRAKTAAAALENQGWERDAILDRLDEVRLEPERFVADETFAPLADELVAARRREIQRELLPRLHDQPIDYDVWGEEQIDTGAIAQMDSAMRLPVSVAGALMPDAHVGYGLPIGGVLATENAVIPYAVGVDIACRMRLSVYPVSPDVLGQKPDLFKRALLDRTYFGAGVSNDQHPDHEVLEDEAWRQTRLLRNLRGIAAKQTGTSGTGNHFVEWGVLTLTQPDVSLGLEPGDYLALLSHSGSRGVGFKIANTYSQLAMEMQPNLDKSVRHLAWLPLDSEAGQEYWNAMELAGRFASANHAVIHRAVARRAGLEEAASVENHHNFCIPGSAYVPTTVGPKCMDEIKTGDHVYAMGDEGLVPTRVIRRWCTGSKPVLVVKTRHRALRCSEDHPVLTVRRTQEVDTQGRIRYGGHLQWTVAKCLRDGDMIACAEGDDGIQGDSITPDKARLLGAFTGDGWRRHDPTRQGHTVGLAIGRRGESHTQKYLSLVTRGLPAATWRDNMPGAFGLTCSSAAVSRELTPFGVLDRSRVRTIPRLIFSASRQAKLAFLAGYADADGSVAGAGNYSHGRVTFCATNETLIRQTRELAISCGLQVTNITRSSTSKTNYGTSSVWSWRFTLDAGSAAQLPLWHDGKARNLLNPPVHSRRGTTRQYTGKIDLAPGLFVERVTRIELQEDEIMFDIEVEHPSHSFVCEGVMVHNCWKEEVDGRTLLVHRKGATPAGPGVLGVIPGSMGDPGYVVRGRGVPRSLSSASHGAGRAMSRRQAIDSIARAERDAYLRERGVTLLGGGIDESPQAYKNINEVIAAQDDLVDIIARFTPRIVRMASEPGDI